MSKRTLIIVVVILLVSATAWAIFRRHGPDPKVEQVRQLQAALDPNLPQEQFQLKFRELQQAHSELTEKQVEELRRNGRGGPGGRGLFSRKTIATYASLPPDKKQAFLDQQIDAMEKWREQMETARQQMDASGQQQGGSAQDHRGPPRGGNVAGQRAMQWRKRMMDSTTPAERAQIQIYRQDLNNQRIQRGLPPLHGGGFF